MMQFDIKRLVPRFIWNDRNGHALAKAMETGIAYFLSVCQMGLDTWGNVDKMPEWRLDELAWEYNILYDYEADINAKRDWVAHATEYMRLNGTCEGIKKYLEGTFVNVAIEENWEYDGDPYHFRVLIADSYTAEALAWANKAVAQAMNLRSVLDSVTFEGSNASAGADAMTAIAGMTGHAGAVAMNE